MTGQLGGKHGVTGTDTGGGIPPRIFTIMCGSGGGQGSTLECCCMDTSGSRSRMDSGQPHGFEFGTHR